MGTSSLNDDDTQMNLIVVLIALTYMPSNCAGFEIRRGIVELSHLIKNTT